MRASRSSTPRVSRANTSPATSPRNISSACSWSAPRRRSTRAASSAPSSKWCAGAELTDASDPRRELLLSVRGGGRERGGGRRGVRGALPDPASVAAAAAPAHVWLAAIGKAAESMARGAHEALGAAIERTLLITRDAPGARFAVGGALEVLLSAHPLPDERSLAAGERLLAWVDALPPEAQPLFLISGGASSLVEVLEAGAPPPDLEELTRPAFAQGVAVGELNARRAAPSRLHGGLAARLRGRPARALFVSDVPQDDPGVIGSGLMGPVASGEDRVERRVVASVDDAVAAVAAAAAALGLTVQSPARRFEGDAARLAARFAHELCLTSAQLCVWGGESTVQVPPHPRP